MLFLSNGKTITRRGFYGVAKSSGASGTWLRRISFPVQVNTHAQAMWKQIFLTTKQNWGVINRDQTAKDANLGLTDAEAWNIQASTYFGILLAGLLLDGQQLQGTLVGCETTDAYYSMVQANRASLGLTPLDTPQLVNQYLALASSPLVFTIGSWTFTVAGPTTASSTDPSLDIAVSWAASPLPAAPTDFSATSPSITCETTDPVLNYQTVASFGPGAATATATSTSITFTQAFDELFASVMGQLLTATGFSPAGYNVTNAIITGNTEFTVTVAVSANPGPMTVSGQISAVEVVTDDYVATVTAVPAPSITPGSTEITLHFTDTNGTHDVVVPVNSSTGTTQVAQPAPTFAFPNRMSAATTYDLDMNVTGFLLTYSWAGSYSTPATRGTVAVSGVWEIVASDSYTSSYSAPDASSWSPILFAGPYMPTPAEVLAAWVAVYGDLPDSGSIKFQAFYIDPDTGTSGPALSATAGWEKGTLKGFSRSSWSGPLFGWSLLAQLTAITAPGSNVQTLALYGLNGYGGTINLSVKSGAVIYTGANSTKKALPSGYTATLSETSVTIPADSTTPVTFTLTQTAESGAQQFDGTVKVAATDGLSSTTSAFELNLSGDVVPQPPPDYLTISPLQSSPAAPSPGIVRLVFTLSNTGPDDIAVTMLSSFSNDSLSANFSDYTSVAATSDATTITFDLPNDGGTNGLIGLTLSSFGYAPDGFNVTDAVVVSNTPTSVTVASSANPGSMTTQGGVGFPNNGFTVAAGSLTTPTTYQTAIAITIPANLDTTGIQVQVEASAGNYTTYAAVRLT